MARRRSLPRLGLMLLVFVGGCRGDTPPNPPRTGPLMPGDYVRALVHDGRERSYILHVPPAGRAKKPLPVVLSFHGGGGHAQSQQTYSKLDRVADAEGFVTVYPNGTGRLGKRLLTWNTGSCCGYAQKNAVDDVGFVRAVVDDVARLVELDRSRVYATGLSNGAMMSYRLAAEASDLVAAIAPVGGANEMAPGPAARAVSVLHIHSVDDGRALYFGGQGPPFPLTNHRVLHPPVERVVARWAAHDGCPKEPEQEQSLRGAAGSLDSGHTATRLVYRPCRDDSEVALIRLSGAGHVWPGGERKFLTWLLGPGTGIVDANRELWAFFRRMIRVER